ncbi:hypothetical protein LCGC14_1786640 [marine sediment metagenome]|uniref:Uncharacterized protein n=1 Tax=marine sediment metagenome TaxID=412755 RepID=A0A0F9JTG0_9ZZZZ
MTINQVYRLDFAFRARPGWPASAELIMIHTHGFDVLDSVKQHGIHNLISIRLIDFEDYTQ